jgi:hypothetical protein
MVYSSRQTLRAPLLAGLRDHQIFRKIHPAHLPRRVDKEFRWSRDVCTVAPAVKVHHCLYRFNRPVAEKHLVS